MGASPCQFLFFLFQFLLLFLTIFFLFLSIALQFLFKIYCVSNSLFCFHFFIFSFPRLRNIRFCVMQVTEPGDSSHETEHYVTPHDTQHISGRREPIGILRMGEGCGVPQTFSALRATTRLASHPHFVLFLPVFLPFFRHYGALSQGRHFYSPRSALNMAC